MKHLIIQARTSEEESYDVNLVVVPVTDDLIETINKTREGLSNFRIDSLCNISIFYNGGFWGCLMDEDGEDEFFANTEEEYYITDDSAKGADGKFTIKDKIYETNSPDTHLDTPVIKMDHDGFWFCIYGKYTGASYWSSKVPFSVLD